MNSAFKFCLLFPIVVDGQISSMSPFLYHWQSCILNIYPSPGYVSLWLAFLELFQSSLNPKDLLLKIFI